MENTPKTFYITCYDHSNSYLQNVRSVRKSDPKIMSSRGPVRKSRKSKALRKLLFPPISEEKIYQLSIDDDSIKYITYPLCAQEISNIIMNNLMDFPCPSKGISEYSMSDLDISTQLNKDDEPKWKEKSLDKRMNQLVITEMTAGVGGNILNFANYFKYVNAIEIDPIRYNYLKKNVSLYGFTNVNCYNDNSIKMLVENDDIVQDIIFVDPPWGGKDYKIHHNLRLSFGDYSIENICKILFQKARNKMIALKLPNNYDFDYLKNELIDYRVSKVSLEKMTIVIIKNYLEETD